MAINFHEFEMIHGWYAFIPTYFSLFSLFGLGFFGVPMLIVNYCFNVNLVKPIKTRLL